MSRIPIPEGLDTRLCVLGENVLPEVPAVLKELWPGLTPVIVADENTWKAAGEEVAAILKNAGMEAAAVKIFPATPMLHADYKYIAEIAPILKGHVPVAVGSGVINDLVKRSHFEAGCAGYLCVATACSVDGYTSFGAALTVNGFKQTVPCPAPLAILADSRVLATAPADMTASGYADLAAKIVAGADWYIADALGITPIDKKAWGMVQVQLRDWLADPEGLATGKLEPMAGLFNGLAATGFAMQYYHESRPASGAEHLFSHIWEMDDLRYQGVNPSHGFKVSVGTLISTALMEYAFRWNKDEVAAICAAAPEISRTERQAQIDHHLLGTPIYDAVSKVCLAKLLEGDALRQRRADIVTQWDAMKTRVAAQIFSFEEMKRRLEILHCPVKAPEIGLDVAEYRRGLCCAAMIRNRYTILDLLFEMGKLDEAIEAVLPRVF